MTKSNRKEVGDTAWADYHLRDWARRCPRRLSPYGLSKEPTMQAVDEYNHQTSPGILPADRTSFGVPRALNFEDK
jgi:hypothetical protein